MSVRALLAWSGGKDSAWALHVLRARRTEVVGLFTTLERDSDCVPIHEVPASLIARQAEAAGVPLETVPLPKQCPNAEYERALAELVQRAKARGVTHLAFGDLFLEEIRRYRERQFAGSGIELLFPLWGMDTRALAETVTASGMRAWVSSVDTRQAPVRWAGVLYDAIFVRGLPGDVDPCGENGEFHTFVFAGPMLRRALPVKPGRILRRGQWAYAEMVLSNGEAARAE